MNKLLLKHIVQPVVSQVTAIGVFILVRLSNIKNVVMAVKFQALKNISAILMLSAVLSGCSGGGGGSSGAPASGNISTTPTLSFSTNLIKAQEDFTTPVFIRITASDADGDTVTLSVSSATQLVDAVLSTLSNGVSTLSFTAIAQAHGTGTLTVQATDVGGRSTSAEVVVVVASVNDTPTLTIPSATLTLVEDFSGFSTIATAIDIENTTLTFSITESTTEVVKVSTSVSGVQISKIANATGQTTLTVTVSDGSLSSMAQVVVTVTTVNDPPDLIVSTSALTLLEDFASVLIRTTRTDIDGDTLTLTLAESSSGIVTVTTSDSSIQIASIKNIYGATTLTISLNDGTTSTSAQVPVIVTPINDPPVLTVSTTVLNLLEGFAPVLIRTTRSDVENNTLTLTVTESNTGVVTITTLASGVQVARIGDSNGATTLTISLSDGTISTSIQVAVIVTPVNDPPVLIVSTTALTLLEDFATPVPISVTRLDNDSNTLTLTVAESATGVVTVTITDAGVQVANITDTNGVTTLTITLSDGITSTSTKVAVIVTPINDPPVLTVSTTALTLLEDFASVQIRTTRIDIDGDTLTLTVTESNTGVVTVTALASGVQIVHIDELNGATTLTISLSDGTISTSTQVSVIVTPVNDPPVLIVSTTALTLLEDFATPVLIRTSRTDIDSNTLTLTVAESATGVVTVTITDAGVQVANITDTNGVTTLTISLSDDSTSTSIQVAVIITPVNDTPTLTIPTTSLSLTEDFEGVFTVATAVNVDGDTLTLSVVESTTEVVRVTTSATSVDVSSLGNANGATTLTITVSDGRLSLTTQVVITVANVNDRPTFTGQMANIVVTEDFNGISTIATAMDEDGDTLTFSVVESLTGVVNFNISTSSVFISSIPNANGQSIFTISVSDGKLSSTAQVIVTVMAVNDTLTLTIPTATVVVTEDFMGISTIATITNDDDDPLTLNFIESDSGLVTVKSSTSGFFISSTANANGQTTLTIFVSDGNQTLIGQVVVRVLSINDTPTLTVSSNALTFVEDFPMVVPIALTSGDIDNDPLSFSVTESTTGVISVTTSASGVQLASTTNANGITTLTISVYDGELSSTVQVVVTVDAVNDTPTLSLSTRSILTFGGFTPITIVTTASDFEDGNLSFTVTESTTGVVRVISTTNAITLWSSDNISGETTLTVMAIDSSGSTVTQTIVVNVIIFPSLAPELMVSTNLIRLQEDFMTSVVIRTTATDANGDTLTLSVSSTTSLVDVMVSTLTNGMSTITLTAIEHANGTAILTVQVRDFGGKSASSEIVVAVMPVNDTPTLTITTATYTLLEDFEDVSTIATAINVDNDTLTFTVVESSTGVVRITTSVTGISFSRIAHAHGVTTLNITVSDGRLSSTGQVVVTVTEVNDTPTLTIPTTTLIIPEDFESVSTIATVINVDNDTLTFTVVQSSTGVVNVTTSAAGVFVSGIDNANGVTTIMITVSDGRLSSTGQVVVTVTAVNDTPTLTIPTATLFLAEDFPNPITVATFSDSDNTTLTLSVVESSSNVVQVSTSASGVHVANTTNANGITTLTISVFDGNLSSTAQVVVVVAAVNDPPNLTIPMDRITQPEDFAGMSTIVTAVDVDSNTLTLSIVESPPGIVKVTTSASGVFISRIDQANGVTTLSITVSDGFLSSTAQIVVDVTSINDPPTLTLSTSSISTVGGFMPITISVTLSDVEDTFLPYSVQASSSGVVSVTTLVDTIILQTISNSTGQTTLTVKTTDSGGLGVTQTIAVDVTITPSPNIPTLLVSTTSIRVQEDFTSSLMVRTTATDGDGDPITLSVNSITPLVNVVISTLTNDLSTITFTAIAHLNGTATLTVRATDNGGQSTSAEIIMAVMAVDDTPTITIPTTNLSVMEDFEDAILVASAIDHDGDSLTISVSESTAGVVTVLSSSTDVRISSIANVNGRTTLTITASDGILSETTQVVVTVNAVRDPVTFTISTSAITLSALGNQLNRNIQSINISNPDNQSLRARWTVSQTGDPIFSANPTPVVSYTTNALTSEMSLSSTTQAAQLYFSIAPNQTGTATLTLQLTDLTRSETAQQTLVVQVNSEAVPPVIAQVSSMIGRAVVYGGRLYANSAREDEQAVTQYLTTVRNLGGHLININTVEEFNFVHSAASGLHTQFSWYGLVLPQQNFPGELSWVSNDSTIAYGFASNNGVRNLTVYPGHYALNWHRTVGLDANRASPNPTVFNWTVYEINLNRFFLIGDGGDSSGRFALYEFPQGLTATPIQRLSVKAGSRRIVRLTGYDLNGDAINTSDWSAAATTGTTSINNVSQTPGVQTVDLVYTAPANQDLQSTVVVTLQVNGLSTTKAVSFTVDGPPSLTISTHAVSLAENFSNFVIRATATDVVDGTLPLEVTASTPGIVTITASTNAIQLSGVPDANGNVTLTVQVRDSVSFVESTLVVVTIQPINDRPILTVSSNSISLLGGFVPIFIGTTATDVDGDVLTLNVTESNPGVVSIARLSNGIRLSPFLLGGSGRTTITITASDSANTTAVQTIAVDVTVMPGTTPVLTVSTTQIRLQEDFTDIVIGTTVTDAEGGTLVVTVSSFTSLVSAQISTKSITLSSVDHLHGTTTLTVRAADAGGLFDSTEIVVIVDSVNDTPTLTVSSYMVNVRSSTVTLNVIASDVEDGILAFSISTGQGVVDTTITTSSLAIIRRSSLIGGQVILMLRATDTQNASYSTSVTVIVPSVLSVTPSGIKMLDFSWGAIPSATHYQLQSEPFFGEGYADLSTTGLIVSPNSTNIRQTSAQALVSLHRYIPRVINPQYGVITCGAISCSPSFRHDTIALTNTQLNGMIGRIVANDVGENDNFGTSVSLSGDGNTLAVGTQPFDTPPRVYIFRRNGSTWSQQANLQASNANQQFIPSLFGQSVSLSADGNTVVVGAPNEGGANSGINNFPSDQSGYQAFGSGAAYVFTFSAGVWSQQAYIKASNAQLGDIFGTFVSLSGDGNTIAVGAINEDSSATGINGSQLNDISNRENTGAVYVFSVVGGSWAQHSYIKASNTGAGDQFGHSGSLSNDGRTLAVGANREDGSSIGINGADNDTASTAGATYVFRFNGIAWNQEAYIKPLNTGADDQFGQSVSLSGNGNMLAVGAFHEDGSSTGVNGLDNNSASDSGATYVFRFMGGAWTQQAYIKAANPDMGDDFGHSVSLSEDGTVLAVGAADEDGSASGVGGNYTNDVSFMNSGATYVFELSNGTWAQRGYVKASDPSSGNVFGRSVSLSNDGGTLAVGASGVNTQSGAVYLY